MTVAVIIPWRSGDLARQRALDWVTERYNDAFPAAELILGGCNPDVAFNRCEAILDGARRTSAETLIVADGDCWTEGIHEAVAMVEQGAAWAIPHRMLCRLTEHATEQVLAGARLEDQEDFAERPYVGFEAGTLFVIRRDVLFDVPPDVRFIGWGQEEQALSLALRCLVAAPWRGKANCFHLWHPPQLRRNRGIGNDANLKLYRRYKVARHISARMRALVDESKAVTV